MGVSARCAGLKILEAADLHKSPSDLHQISSNYTEQEEKTTRTQPVITQ